MAGTAAQLTPTDNPTRAASPWAAPMIPPARSATSADIHIVIACFPPLLSRGSTVAGNPQFCRALNVELALPKSVRENVPAWGLT